MSFVYLASPYTPHAGESIEERVAAARQVAARLMAEGCVVFSPVSHSHEIADHLAPALRLDHEFWMRQDLAILRYADRLVVLRLPGWLQSRGVLREIACAKDLGIPIDYLDA